MKKLLPFFVILFFSSTVWSQKSTGLIVTLPSANFYFKLPDDSRSAVSTYKGMGGIGWYRQKWHNERLFRAWDIRVFFAKGDIDMAYLKKEENIPELPDAAEYKAYGFSLNWKLGMPLFHNEFDDRFFWYATAGVGFDFGYYENRMRYRNVYGPHEYQFSEEIFQPKFLDLGIGFESRMAQNWYVNVSGNLAISYHIGANISVRLLRRKTSNFKF